MHTRTTSGFGLCAAGAVLLVACSTQPADSVGSSIAGLHGHPGGGSHAHIMPPRQQPRPAAVKQTAGPPNAHLTYNGGPVLSSSKVFTIFWGSGATTYQTQLGDFFTAVGDSAYFDWLSEYNTPSQSIGRASYLGTYVDPSPPSGATIDDSQIQSELANLIGAGSVPAPDANTLYFFYFPAGITITMQGQASCSAFCGYHGNETVGSDDVRYAVIPDQACCTGAPEDQLQTTTEVSSHEWAEATTDADVGTNNLAWYDQANGEIGDICAWMPGTMSGFTVQLLWSNANNDCIDQAPGGAGGGDAGAGGGDASVGGGDAGMGGDVCAGVPDGSYCGGDGVTGDPATLYGCAGGALASSAVCSNGCNADGLADGNDSCN